jgi:hypothetical protein
MSSESKENGEARGQRFNFGGAAKQLHALQQQLSDYKSLLDHVQQVGEGTEQLAQASQRLADEYNLIAEVLNEEDWTLYADAQQAREELQATQDAAENIKTDVQDVAQLASAASEALEASRSRMQQVHAGLNEHPIRNDIDEVCDQIQALNERLEEGQRSWARIAKATETLEGSASGTELESIKKELRRLRDHIPQGEASDLTDDLFPSDDAPFWKRLGHRPEHRFWASCLAIVVVIVFGVFGIWSPSPSSKDEAKQSVNQVQPDEVAIQVLNSVSESGLASRTQRLLEKAGFDVPVIGNSPAGRLPQTTMFLHSPAQKAAEQVARRLQLDPRQIRPGPPAASGIDITIVLGADFQSLPAEVRPSSDTPK